MVLLTDKVKTGRGEERNGYRATENFILRKEKL